MQARLVLIDLRNFRNCLRKLVFQVSKKISDHPNLARLATLRIFRNCRIARPGISGNTGTRSGNSGRTPEQTTGSSFPPLGALQLRSGKEDINKISGRYIH